MNFCSLEPSPQRPASGPGLPPGAPLHFWVTQLSGAPTLLELPTDRARPAVQDTAASSLSFALDDKLLAALLALGQRHGVSLCVTLLAAWASLLGRLSGQSDVVIGTPAARRPGTDAEPHAGVFGNMLALRVDLSAAPTVAELLAQVRATTLAAQAHQDTPLQQVIEALGVVHSPSHRPLFQVLFAHHDSPRAGFDMPPGLDLSLELDCTGDTLTGTLSYAVALFDRSTAERHVRHWMTLLQAMADGDGVAVPRLALLDAAERARVVREWNATDRAFPAESCIHELFEAQVALTPQATALTCGSTELSYAALNAQANQLAHHLVSLGVRPDTLVAIALPRGLPMVVAALATLKAGGAYVPLDLDYPRERLAFMLHDSAPVALVTQASVRAALGPAAQPMALVDLDAVEQPWAGHARTNLDRESLGLRSSHLAYVIYTSGSTGRPKGVMIEHAGVCNLALAQIEGFGVEHDSRVLQFASFSFDACISEFVMALCRGAALCVPPPGPLVGRDLLDVLCRQRITHVTVAPPLLATFPDDAKLPHLKTLVVAGEACGREIVQRWAPGRRLINAYGPTETTVCATLHDCDVSEPASPGIGRPIANTRIYVLDALGEPVPIGVAGEIHIGGAGVARGYLNRPELSAERFVPDPFSAPTRASPARMFKTGDLGRWRPDGRLEFLGRNDHQVKIRGLRIELGEIETAIACHPDVRQVAVIGQHDESQGPRLIAYVASESDPNELIPKLRTALRESLPTYMMPSRFVVVDRMPTTPNGKLDRKALPAIRSAPLRTDATLAPRNSTEQVVWALWRDVLKSEHFGVLDNFFDVGGDSLMAVELRARLEDRFSTKLSTRVVLEAQSVAQQAALLQGDPRPNDTLVQIRPGARGPAVFLVHDGFGETLVYRNLAQRLRPDISVYGLCPQTADGIAMVHTRISEIAASYVARIRLIQPHGPYLLGGLCAGGMIAYEMARKLQRDGEGVGMLALMDASDFAARKKVGRFALKQIKSFSGAMAQRPSLSDPVGSINGLLGFVTKVAHLMRGQVTVRVNHIQASLKARVLRYCLDRGRNPPRYVRSLSTDQIYALAESSHVVDEVFHGDVILFRASSGNGDFADEPLRNLFRDPLLGWGRRVRGKVQCMDIGGGHYSMFQEPNVAAMAHRIQQQIDDVLGAKPASSAPEFDDHFSGNGVGQPQVAPQVFKHVAHAVEQLDHLRTRADDV